MSDLVKRLRDAEACLHDPCRVMDARSGCICAEAADEIEFLCKDREYWYTRYTEVVRWSVPPLKERQR